ncbi:SPOSA6832_01511, partial [Sporobolomyces salmonicolor]
MALRATLAGPNVFGGGGSDFVPKVSNGNVSKIERFQKRGYEFVTTNMSLHELGNDKRALGLFSASTMPTWLDRNIFREQNLADFRAWNPANRTFTAPTVDTPGLKEMTIKAIDILSARSKKAGVPFMLMSEAASIDKAMHVGDMERVSMFSPRFAPNAFCLHRHANWQAISELLELDNTVKTVLAHLEKIGHREDTLVVVTADHGHGFDVFGSADTAYLKAQTDNDKKREAVGTYLSSGLSGYQAEEGASPQNQTVVFSKDGPGFPVNWSPRYTAAWGFAADVDRYEQVHNKTRDTSIKLENGTYRANEEDGPGGFFVSGNLPVGDDQGVHSLVDVPVYAWGPGHELFRGIQNSPEIAFKIAHALDLGRDKNVTKYPAAEYGSEKVLSGRYVAQARKVAL